MSPVDPPFARVLAPHTLVAAALCAIAGAALGGLCGPAGVAACAVAALAPIGRFRAAVACALPAALAAWSPPAAEVPWPEAGPVAVEGEVEGPVRRDRPAGRATVLVAPVGGGQPVRCSVGLPQDVTPLAILPGDRVRGTGFFEGVSPRGEDGRPPLARTELAALEVEQGGGSPARLATALRLALEDALSARLHGEAGRLCCHLVLGDGPALPDELVAAHRATGLAHLLAVSGAHASMLAWLLGLAYRAARGRDPWSARGYRRTCGAILIVYGAVTGWEPPVFRALVAFFVASWAAANGRRTTIAAALAAPALLTAWIAPQDLTRVSFWLSYAAVVGLSAAGAFGPGGPWRDALRTAIRASAWTLATTAVLSLVWFGQIAPWTVLGTPLCAPIVALMLGLGLVTAVLGLLVPPLADVLAAPLQLAAETYLGIVRVLAELPAAPIHAPWRPDAAVLAAFVIAAVVQLALRPTRRRLLVACLLPCVPFFVPFGVSAEHRITLCDVGHGQACVIALGEAGTAVVDCGAHVAGPRAARRVVDALPRRRAIDVLVLSHADADHVNGVAELLTRVAIRQAVLPVHMRGSAAAHALRRRGVRCTWLEPGRTIRPLDGLVVRAPRVAAGRASDNDESLWVRVTQAGLSTLLPGDAESRGIAHALAEGIAEASDVLVLPHHGRGPAAANARLLERVQPVLALASDGDARAEPPLAVLARAHGIRVLRTSTRGRIDVALDRAGDVACRYPERIDVTGRRRPSR